MSQPDQPFLPPIVRRKGRHRRRNAAKHDKDAASENNSHYYLQPKRCSIQKLLSIVRGDAVNELAMKIEHKIRSHLLTDAAAGDDCIQQIVIFGIGSFMTCHMSRTQLALICALRQRIGPQIQTLAFDPVLLPEDYRLLQEELAIDPILQNESCKRCIRNCPGKVLFFMPHLDKEFYSNLLQANWQKGVLDRVIVLGNSFTSISDSQPTRILLTECPYVVHCMKLSLLQEHALDFIEDFDDSLNDLSLHTFRTDGVRDEELVTVAVVT